MGELPPFYGNSFKKKNEVGDREEGAPVSARPVRHGPLTYPSQIRSSWSFRALQAFDVLGRAWAPGLAPVSNLYCQTKTGLAGQQIALKIWKTSRKNTLAEVVILTPSTSCELKISCVDFGGLYLTNGASYEKFKKPIR